MMNVAIPSAHLPANPNHANYYAYPLSPEEKWVAVLALKPAPVWNR
jgi:hypothetical protein